MSTPTATVYSDRRTIIKAFFRPVYPADASRAVVYQRLSRLMGPAFVEYALLQMVNMFDQMQVGGLGEAALAAVGLSGQIKTIFVTVFMAVNVGLTAMAAKATGEHNREDIPVYVRHGLLITLTIALVVSVVMFLLAEPLLRLFNVPDELSLRYGTQYLQICMFGFVPVALTTVFTAALRGIGDTRVPMMYNLVANFINIFLNWVLINGNLGMPRLEVRGAALATILGQYAAFFIACFVCLRRGNRLYLQARSLLGPYRRYFFHRILNIGFPSMLESAIGRFGTATFTAIVASLGTTLYATHVVCINIQLLTGMSGNSFSVAATTLSGQSLGAKRKDLAVLYSNCAAKLCLVVSAVLIVLYVFFGAAMISWYNDDPGIISAGITPLRIVALMQPFAALQYVYAGAMRGAGDTRSVALCYTFAQLVCRPLFAYTAIHFLNMGLNGAWWALACSESICALLLCIRFTSGKWMRSAP